MSFWTREVEPKRKFRWTLSIGTFKDVEWLLKSAAKPAWNVTEHPHKFLHHTFHYPGRVEWQPLDITLVDAGGPKTDIGGSFLSALGDAGYKFPTDMAAAQSSITKKKAVESIGSVTITQYGADQNTLDEWTLWNPFFTNVKTGDGLTYDADDLVEVTATIVYDWAELKLDAGTSPANGATGLTSLGGSKR